MTITVIQETSTRHDAATNFTRAFVSNVAVGSLVVVAVWSSSTAAFVAGDCTKSAGTATIGAVQLDKENDFDVGSGEIANAAIWSAIVTGAGSLTMNVAVPDGSYGTICVGEYGGSWDAARLEDSDVGQNATDGTSAADTASMTSAGAALFIGSTAVMGSDAGTTCTANSPLTNIASESDNTAHQAGAAARNIYASGTTATVGWAINTSGITNRGWTAVGAVYKEAGGGTVTGTGAATLGAITVSGTAERVLTSTGAITLGPITVSGAGAGAVSGSGAITLGPVTISGTAERAVTDVGGSVDLILPAIVVSGAQGADTITGTGAVALGAIAVSSAAEREIPGSGVITLGPITVSAQGLLVIDGAGAITLPAIEVSGTNAQPDVSLGGDDAPRPRHRGYNLKRAKLRLNKAREYEESIRQVYRELTADPVTRERAEAVIAPPIVERDDESARQHAARVAARDRALRLEQLSAEKEIALRMLHRELIEMQHIDDEQAVMELLGMVL